MDAHGGWIASVLDLAKFAACFDDPANCPLLTAESIAIMHGRPDGLAGYEASGEPKDVYYSLGWQNRVLDKSSSWVNHWHTGSLPGTATILVRRHDGYNVVAFLNSRTSPKTKQLGNALDKLIGKSINP
jgi:N-acyl-D-amino-acid deacylase